MYAKTSMMSCHSSIKSQSINFFIILALHQQQKCWSVFIFMCECLAECKEVTSQNLNRHNFLFSSLHVPQEIVVSNKQSHGLLQPQNILYFQIHRPQCLQDSAVFVRIDEVYCLKAKLDSGVPFKKKYKNFICLPRTFIQYFLP